MLHPGFTPAPSALGLFFVAGGLALGVGYAFLAHPRRVAVWRHPLETDVPSDIDGTTAAIYQAFGFLAAVFGSALWTLLLLGDTRVPSVWAAAAGVAVVAVGLALARTDTRRWQHAGVGVVIVGLGLFVGGAFVRLAV